VSRKREPVAEIGAEDYRIVRHTHDVELATTLMVAKLVKEIVDVAWPEPLDQIAVSPGRPRQVWMRIVPCLPGSYGDAEGWKFEYRECDQGRGAFPAVVFS
jgi:hypothetical protein